MEIDGLDDGKVKECTKLQILADWSVSFTEQHDQWFFF